MAANTNCVITTEKQDIHCPLSASVDIDDLESMKQELQAAKKLLSKTQRQLEQSEAYNEELRKHIESLSSELHAFRHCQQVDRECQVDDADIKEAFGDKPFPDWSAQSIIESQGHSGDVSIAESIKETASQLVWEQAGYVLDPKSGMYYDYNSGYYYDASRGLYYDSSSGCSWYYDQTAGEYKVYLQVSPTSQGSQPNSQAGEEATPSSKTNLQNAKLDPECQTKRTKKKFKEKPKVKIGNSQIRVDELTAGLQQLQLENGRKNALELSNSWPPCIRVIVLASDIVDRGTFFLITCTGGTIGRDPDPRHVIQIADINISKIHAEVKFDFDNKCYTIRDLGSQNGTFINELRISQVKVASADVPVSHGDILQIANTRMLLHIHPSSETCDECEPGQVMAAIRAQQTVHNDHVIVSNEERRRQVRQQLKKIKKKYGLENSSYVDNMDAVNNPKYENKADTRRMQVGSEHPSHHRITNPASVHRPISAENKGHNLLSKMGWKEGMGLGKDSAGRTEPVNVELRASQTAGLGSQGSTTLSLDDVHLAHKAKRWTQAQERFYNLNKGCMPLNKVEQNFSAGETKNVPADGTKDCYIDNRGDSSLENKSTSKIQFSWIKGDTHKPP